MTRESGRQVFFFQAEDGIRAVAVTGVQTCALPICDRVARRRALGVCDAARAAFCDRRRGVARLEAALRIVSSLPGQIGRASCREEASAWQVRGEDIEARTTTTRIRQIGTPGRLIRM